MTVKELKEALSKFDDNLNVNISTWDTENDKEIDTGIEALEVLNDNLVIVGQPS